MVEVEAAGAGDDEVVLGAAPGSACQFAPSRYLRRRHCLGEDDFPRAEVILEEAVERPEVAPGCKLAGEKRFSPYDNTWVTAASGLDVDHLVPLAESWDSGASAWTAKRREAYANDLATPTSLITVTAKSNRAKADKGPADWMPPAAEYACTYVTGWVETKLRWGLAADDREREALLGLAEDCPGANISYEIAP
ncbi:HNH endonuclease family protein [Streptomyces sp. NBC_00503]|uniref:HNH endonuclease family protein n=1 Tax=Streptomyces sp. NBC_00503 TaxID=2903659 RepID=UPI002E81527D|nr:HNH endonuclease family protein [Streptomyces sp. NBC_00503]WUD79156.1 HNH endonuclease family protein [Streptomyces sp. NBC_00503]